MLQSRYLAPYRLIKFSADQALCEINKLRNPSHFAAFKFWPVTLYSI